MNSSGTHNWLKHWDFILIDLFALAFSFGLSYFIRFGNLGFISNTAWQRLLVILLILNLLITLITNPYSGVFRRPYYEDAIKMFLLALYSFICASVFFYLFKMGASYSRLMLVGMYIIYYVLSLVLKSIRKKSLLSGSRRSESLERRRIIVLTEAGKAEETTEFIYSSDYVEFDIVGYCFVGENSEGDTYHDLPVVPFDQLVEYALRNHIDGVFIGVNPAVLSKEDYETLVVNEITPHISIESLVGIQTDVQQVGHVGVYRTLDVGKYTFDSGQAVYLVIKRVFDVIFGLLGCVLLVFVALGAKISYLISGDTAPILLTQDRVGMRGRPFKMYKLRSMVPNADEVLEELLEDEQNRREWEETQKLTNDPRITPTGAVLRKTSLDEFPQFINVLKGDMSIVGPRPLMEGELEEHGGLTLYNKVRPGITGWWACNGRSNISYRERLELEYHYVRHCSLYLDVLCVFRTFLVVLKKEGAV